MEKLRSCEKCRYENYCSDAHVLEAGACRWYNPVSPDPEPSSDEADSEEE